MRHANSLFVICHAIQFCTELSIINCCIRNHGIQVFLLDRFAITLIYRDRLSCCIFLYLILSCRRINSRCSILLIDKFIFCLIRCSQVNSPRICRCRPEIPADIVRPTVVKWYFIPHRLEFRTIGQFFCAIRQKICHCTKGNDTCAPRPCTMTTFLLARRLNDDCTWCLATTDTRLNASFQDFPNLLHDIRQFIRHALYCRQWIFISQINQLIPWRLTIDNQLLMARQHRRTFCLCWFLPRYITWIMYRMCYSIHIIIFGQDRLCIRIRIIDDHMHVSRISELKWKREHRCLPIAIIDDFRHNVINHFHSPLSCKMPHAIRREASFQSYALILSQQTKNNVLHFMIFSFSSCSSALLVGASGCRARLASCRRQRTR